MKKLLFLCILSVFKLTSGITQSTVEIRQSLGIEYGFVGIPSDDMVGQLMFAKQRVYVYGDDQYILIRKIATGEAKTMDGIPLQMITSPATGETWFCVTLDDKKLRTKEAGQNLAQSLGFADMMDSNYKFSKETTGIPAVQGYTVENWKFESEDLVPLSFYMTQAFGPAERLEKWPFYIKKDADNAGVCLGSDKFAGKIYQLRALKIDIDQKLDLATELGAFTPAGEKEISDAMKKYLGF